MRIPHLALVAALALVSLRCGKDTLPPPAPAVDPVASPTSLTNVTITGTAQYGAQISIGGAAGVAPAAIVADPYSARFRAVVTLARNTRNTLTFTAIDQGGKTSPPTTIIVDQSDNYAVSVQNLRVNGTACAPGGVPPACAAASGDTVDIDVIANSGVGISEVQYNAFFSTAGANGTLRTQRVLVPPNAPSPFTQHFTFTIPAPTLIETVPLEALMIDSQGNRSTSPALVLSVTPISAGGRVVGVPLAGGLVSGPNDIAFNANGDLLVGNDGRSNLLKLAAGSMVPVVFSPFAGRSNYLVVDVNNNVYVTSGGQIVRVDPAGTSATPFVSQGGGYTLTGLALDGPTVAKGLVDASGAAVLAGNTVTVGSQTYEFRAGATGCAAGNVCVDLNAPNRNQALATAVLATNTVANAVFDAGSNRAVLAAKSAGEAGNTIALTASASITVTGAGKLAEGHGEDLFVGQFGGPGADTNIYRFSEALTPLPGNLTANDGTFSVLSQQLGVAMKDFTTPASPNLRDLYLYFVDQGGGQTFVRAFHAVDTSVPTSIFGLSNGGGAIGAFGNLYDLALASSGCLLVSDQGKNRIYAVDVRTPNQLSATPAVTLIASGFSAAAGLAVYRGDLYVADNGLNAVVKISPLPGTTGCF